MTDEEFMRKAVKLAMKGEGWTNPNPKVGAVIVKNGEIIGEGYHQKYGELHAERNAIASLTEEAEGATLYVTLEPCCHYGKTPPCTDAILKSGIKRVVIGSRDPNPKVSGKGVAILRNSGLIVEEDFMKKECDEINPVFFHFIEKHTPYVVMKFAMTVDGKIATKTGASKWITGQKSRIEVQKMRNRYMGIMVGIGTVLTDDPMLNTRFEGMKSPIRIVCDSNLRIPLDSKICRSAYNYKTIVVCTKDNDEKRNKLELLGVEVLKVPDENGEIDLNKLMIILGEKNIDSILLEGGGTLNYSALKAGIVNELWTFISPKIFGGIGAKTPVEGIGAEIPSEAVMLKYDSTELIDEDLLIKYKVRRP